MYAAHVTQIAQVVRQAVLNIESAVSSAHHRRVRGTQGIGKVRTRVERIGIGAIGGRGWCEEADPHVLECIVHNPEQALRHDGPGPGGLQIPSVVVTERVLGEVSVLEIRRGSRSHLGSVLLVGKPAEKRRDQLGTRVGFNAVDIAFVAQVGSGRVAQLPREGRHRTETGRTEHDQAPSFRSAKAGTAATTPYTTLRQANPPPQPGHASRPYNASWHPVSESAECAALR